MVNISLLEKSIPVAPIKIAALDSCHELAQKVDSHLVQFRQELDSHNKSGLSFRGYSEDTFLIESKCPRFGSGEAKGVINESVRGTDLFVMQQQPEKHIESMSLCHFSMKAVSIREPKENLLTVHLRFRNW